MIAFASINEYPFLSPGRPLLSISLSIASAIDYGIGTIT
jgi:hypothetical protein